MQLAGGTRGAFLQPQDDSAGGFRFGFCRRPEPFGYAVLWRADIAFSADAPRVCGVSEMPNQAGHATLAGLRILHGEVELRLPPLRLECVRVTPLLVTLNRVLVEIQHPSAVDGELFERFFKQLGVHLQRAANLLFVKRLRSQTAINAIKDVSRWIVAFEEKFMRLAVRIGVEQYGPAWQAIASGAANLLVIGFEAPGQRSVYDGAYIRLVDAHSESDGRHDGLQAALLKFALHRIAVLRIETGMIGGRRKFRGKLRRQRFGLLACRRIHNRGTPRLIAQQARDKGDPQRRRHLHNFNGEILAAEPINESGGLGHSQLRGDVVLYPRCSRRCECNDRRRTQCGKKLPQHAIVRTKIMAPLGDAVSLVNCDQAGFAPGQHFNKTGDPQPLRRNE